MAYLVAVGSYQIANLKSHEKFRFLHQSVLVGTGISDTISVLRGAAYALLPRL
jgi:hypothetical protein